MSEIRRLRIKQLEAKDILTQTKAGKFGVFVNANLREMPQTIK